MEGKKPRYGLYVDDEYFGILNWHDAIGQLKSIVMENYIDDGYESTIVIKRVDMTDAEFEAVPEE